MHDREEGDIEPSRDRDVQQTPAVAERSTSHRGRIVLPVVVGFLAGAVFWHLVGFWSLVSDMVFHGPREKTVVVSNGTAKSNRDRSVGLDNLEIVPIVTRSGLARGSVSHRADRNVLSAVNCTTLAQERPGGPIKKVPCPVGGPTRDEAIVTGGFVDDVAARRNLSRSEGGGWSSITTGSIGSVEGPIGAPLKLERGWATSLDVTP